MLAGWTRLRWVGLGVAIILSIAILLGAVYFNWILPKQRFADVTGFQLPSNATFVANEVLTTGPLGTDGVRGVEFQVDAQTIGNWLKEKPFRGASAWATGPIRRGMILDFPMPPTSVMS